MNVAELLRRAGRAAGEAPALAHGPKVIADYAAFAGLAAALAGGLAMRLQRGDRVALVMKNTPDYAVALYACWWAGLVAVPVNAKLHPSELAYILQDSGAGLVLATSNTAEGVAQAAATVDRPVEVLVTGSPEWRRLGAADAAPLHEASAGEAAWLFYTSGTTGRPKGATLTHRNLRAMSLAYLADVGQVSVGDGLLHAAPMSHGSGLYILPFVSGMGLQIVPESGRFEPAEIFALTRAHPSISLFAAPTMIRRMSAAARPGDWDAAALRTIVYGGGPMYVEDCKHAVNTFGPCLAQIYGQGESPMTITVLPKRVIADVGHPRYEARLASVGFASAVTQVRVAGEDDAALPPGEAGEILVRGDTVMHGYWNRDDATAETLRGGWLHTGDVGSFDEDGFLTLKDRAKDVIISGGSNIYPREVEEVLLRHPSVLEVSVVGRPHADWGEEVVAFVVAGPVGAPDREALDALCNQHIARFKRPKEYRFVPELPKNEYGKVLKTTLRTAASGH